MRRMGAGNFCFAIGFWGPNEGGVRIIHGRMFWGERKWEFPLQRPLIDIETDIRNFKVSHVSYGYLGM